MKEYEDLPEDLPDDYTALSEAPTSGGQIIHVGNGSVPSDVDVAAAIAEAAEVVGWSSDFFAENGSVEDINAKLQAAVEAGPDAITHSGTPPEAIQVPLAAAEEAGIPVTLGAEVVPPDPASGYTNGILGPDSWVRDAEIMANWVMQDSECTGNAVLFGIPFPVLKLNGDQFVESLTSACSSCGASYKEIQTKDIGTPAATQAMVSALQADPSIKYVGVNLGVVATGLSGALAQAGITDVKIFGISPDAPNIKALQDGTEAMWIGRPSELFGWVYVDAVLRHQDTGQSIAGLTYPSSVLTTENIPEDATGVATYPSDFKEEFTQLWLGE